MRVGAWTLVATVGLVTAAAPCAAGVSQAPQLLLLRGIVVTMNATHEVIPNGRVLVRGEKIVAVWSGDSAPVPVSRARVVDAGPGGLIFPGLINLHDHPDWDFLSLWPPPSSHKQSQYGRPTGLEPYANRYEWGAAAAWGGSCPPCRPIEHDRLLMKPGPALGNMLDLGDELLLYAEAQAALGGETTMQGGVAGLLVRAIELENFGRQTKVAARTGSIKASDANWATLRKNIANKDILVWLVHLAEGIRDGDLPQGANSSRDEFKTLVRRKLLTSATAVVHGVGLERADFAKMRAHRASLVWSPLSNLLLYGRTANVFEALGKGVTVALGSDWTSSGSKSLLDELKIADIALRDPRVLALSRKRAPRLAGEENLDRALVDMVTRNPARILRWNEVGSIAPRKYADVLVIRRPRKTPTGGMPDTPYRNLIDATSRDVRLVLVDGVPVAGDSDAMKDAGAEVFESVGSEYSKAVAFRAGSPPLNLTVGQAEFRLRSALRALGGDGAPQASGPPPPSAIFSYLRGHWLDAECAVANVRKMVDDCTDLTNAEFRQHVLLPFFGTTPDGRLNLERIEPTPLLTADDHFFFTVLEGRKTSSGFPADRSPPFELYRANTNQARVRGNPFAGFFKRWYD